MRVNEITQEGYVSDWPKKPQDGGKLSSNFRYLRLVLDPSRKVYSSPDTSMS